MTDFRTQKPPRALADKIQLGRFLGIKPRTVDKYVGLKKIPCIRISRKIVRFDLDAVLAALR